MKPRLAWMFLLFTGGNRGDLKDSMHGRAQ